MAELQVKVPLQCKSRSELGHLESRGWAFSLTMSSTLISPQELLKDGKRETTISQLLINPTDLDIGRVFTCRSVNEAIPSGKETSIELDVHREQGPRGRTGWRSGVGKGMWASWRSTEESSRGPRTEAHFLHPVKFL